MPEGDTILRAARTLGRAIGGRIVTGARSTVARVDAASLVGRTVAAVEARGKNLIVRFDDGRLLRTHMQMTGSWHIYRPGERWRKSEGAARVVLETDAFVAVCFQAPVVELLRAKEEAGHAPLAGLGPDILGESFDVDEACARLRGLGEMELGAAILEQRAVAGIGNIYKSESLYAAGVDPFRRVREVSDAELRAVLKRARALMKANVREDAFVRTTAGAAGGRYWVYRRSGRACRRCAEAIRMRRQGEGARSTYYCARCQNVPG